MHSMKIERVNSLVDNRNIVTSYQAHLSFLRCVVLTPLSLETQRTLVMEGHSCHPNAKGHGEWVDKREHL